MPQRVQNFDSNGPNVKIRGNAYQVFERYVALAREAATSGDRIAAENLYQHAEHYYRIMNADGGGNGQMQQRPTNPADVDMGASDGDQPENGGGAITTTPPQPQHQSQPDPGDEQPSSY